MILHVDPGSAVPPYEQIRSQAATMITTGVLPVGARLPTIRQLSKDLGLAGGTVARAYRELESEGLIATRGRHGSFVARMDGTARRSAPVGALADAAQAFAARVRQLGADPNRALEFVREAFESLDVDIERRREGPSALVPEPGGRSARVERLD
jgi:DNA-binding transcriptional regulator YhcF (GntR family)